MHFLNNQLADSENSVFCDMKINVDTLPGFKAFVVKFMLQMAKVRKTYYLTNKLDKGNADNTVFSSSQSLKNLCFFFVSFSSKMSLMRNNRGR